MEYLLENTLDIIKHSTKSDCGAINNIREATMRVLVYSAATAQQAESREPDTGA
jgi:hypothetical protein